MPLWFRQKIQTLSRRGGVITGRMQRLAPNQPLRFICTASNDINSYRIGALFETEPELDGVLGAIIRNGYCHIGDLHTAHVTDVFAGSEARLDERRRIIERLKTNAQVKLMS